MNVLTAVTLLVPLLSTIALFWMLPGLWRRDLFFAVTVPPDFGASAAAEPLVRRYRAQVALHGAAGTALALAGLAADRMLIASVGLVWPAAGAVAAFLSARARVLPHAVAPVLVREASLAPRPPLPGGLAGQLAPFAILGGALLAAIVLRDRLPGGLAPVAGQLGLAAGVCAVVLLVAVGIQRGSRPVDPGSPREGRFRAVNLAILLFAEILAALMAAVTACRPLFPALDPALPAIVAAHAAMVVIVIVILARMGQGGSRLPGPPAAAAVGDRTPDRSWRWGLFYVNREDPAIFVEKRMGIGYTLNFGNPWAWLILAAIAAVPVVAVLLR